MCAALQDPTLDRPTEPHHLNPLPNHAPLPQQAMAGKSRSLNNLVMHLRKACNHPYLLYPDYNPPNPLDTVGASGKFVLLDHVLPKLRRAGWRDFGGEPCGCRECCWREVLRPVGSVSRWREGIRLAGVLCTVPYLVV